MINTANLLIVDDTPTNLVYLEAVIRNPKINLIQALSGYEALEKAAGIELALAIIDVRMPEMDGIELATKINKQSKQKVPVIFLTAGYLIEEEILSGYDSGAVDFISKPFSKHVLNCKINVFLDLFDQKQTVIRDAEILKETTTELLKTNLALQKSERRLFDITFSMAEWVWEVNKEGVYTHSSTRGPDLLGVSIDEIIGKKPFDFMVPEEVDNAITCFSQIMKNRDVIKDFENWNVKGNGERICLLTNGVPFFDDDGNLEGYRGVDKDITERKIAETILKESESSLAEAQKMAHTGSWEWNIITSKVKWSKEMFRIFDITPDTYDGSPESIMNVLHPDDVEIFTNSMNRNLSADDDPSLEYRVIHRDGSIHHLKAEGRLEFDSSGQPFRSIGTVQDITDGKRAQKELHQANIFLDSIVENIPNMVFIKDAKTLNFVRFNLEGENLTGITKDEIIGKKDFDFFPKEQAERFVADDLQTLRNKVMIDIPEESIQTLHQGVRILHTKKVPILDDKGDPEYLLGISEDISERIIAEQTLKLSEEKYRTMLNASPDGIFLIDLNGIITDVSEIGIELFGFDNKMELIGRLFSGFINAEEKNTYSEIIEKTLNEGIAQNIEVGIRKKNQTLFLSEVSSTFMQGVDGKHFSFMIIIRDISQRKKTETKQIHADRMANLGEMASGMAHEINQPLNIISMVMDKILFEIEKTDSVNVEFLKNKSGKIFENITRIRNIIDHVRSFSRSQDAYISTAFDINVSIENALTMISEQFKHLGVNLRLQLERNIPQILGNTYNFEQVIINLLSNAKDAVLEKKNRQKDFDEMIVEIKTFQSSQSLIVEIIDNGIGIENTDFTNIMLPFYTTKEEGKGTGLGLSICYQIIKEMGGTIDIASDRYVGTKVKLMLDIRKSH